MTARRCSYHDEPVPCWRCNSEEAGEREFDAEGRTLPSPYPCRGHVWFDDGEKHPAAIYGTWNGWAVATVPKKAALEMIRTDPDLTIVKTTARGIVVRNDAMGTVDKIPISGSQAFFCQGWALHHSCSRDGSRPQALPKHWQRLCKGMES